MANHSSRPLAPLPMSRLPRSFHQPLVLYHSIELTRTKRLRLMTPTSSPTLLVLAAGMGSRYGGLKQIDPLARLAKPSSTTRSSTLSAPDSASWSSLSARTSKSNSARSSARALKSALRWTTSSRRSKTFLRASPCLTAAPSRGAPRRPSCWLRTPSTSPFAAINADDFYGADGYRSLAGHLTSGSPDYAMVGFVLRNTLSEFGSVARGVCQVSTMATWSTSSSSPRSSATERGAQHRPRRAKSHSSTATKPVSMNMWGFTPQSLRSTARAISRSFLRAMAAI